MTEDDTNQPPKADPMAAARASKARKAAEKAEQELAAAEQSAATAANNQPTISTLRGRPEIVEEGEHVDMIVTFKGHGQISTGGEWGFERLARKAEFRCGENSGRDLFNKGWAEPVDVSLAEKWERLNVRDRQLAERRGQRERDVMENGVNANETWSTGANG